MTKPSLWSLAARSGTSGTIGAIAMLATCVLGPLAAPARAATPVELQPLEQKYGLKVIALGQPVVDRDRGYTVSCQPPSDAALLAYMPLVAQEFALYPRDLVAAVGLERLVLCRDLYVGRDRRGAVPDEEDHALFLDVEAQGSSDRFFRARVIHHEFMHMIDLRDDGRYDDPAWAALNRPGFRYGDGGRSRQGDSLQGMVDTTLVGFLTRYSDSGPEEDKAELFSYLMMRPKWVTDRTYNDDVLRRKVERLKANLAAFAPSMNSWFWAELERVRGGR